MHNWKTLLEAAYDYNVVANNNYSWILAEVPEVSGLGFELNRTDYEFDEEYNNDEDVPVEYKWKHALNGMGQLSLHIPEHKRFQSALWELSKNETLRQEYIDTFHEPELWENQEWTLPDNSYFANMNYDAMISLGLAACQTPGLFTWPELYDTLKTVEFEGTTGHVKFHPTTLNRDVDSVPYGVHNIYLSDERSDEFYIRFESKMAALVSNGTVQHLHPFHYFDNTTTRPLEIPPVADFDYNLVPMWAQVFGLCLASLVMFLSLLCIGWTLFYRNKSVILAAQPIFLCQLAAGTFVMASAVIPMSFQGPRGTPWS